MLSPLRPRYLFFIFVACFWLGCAGPATTSGADEGLARGEPVAETTPAPPAPTPRPPTPDDALTPKQMREDVELLARTLREVYAPGKLFGEYRWGLVEAELQAVPGEPHTRHSFCEATGGALSRMGDRRLFAMLDGERRCFATGVLPYEGDDNGPNIAAEASKLFELRIEAAEIAMIGVRRFEAPDDSG